jgi:hypothetical protein
MTVSVISVIAGQEDPPGEVLPARDDVRERREQILADARAARAQSSILRARSRLLRARINGLDPSADLLR